MIGLSNKLRIGEKIGFGFGLVGLLFLGVVWQYHQTLQRSLAEYRELQDHYGAKRFHALEIENGVLAAQRAEKDFLLKREELYVRQNHRNVEIVLREVEKLAALDTDAAATAEQIRQLMNVYGERFQMVVDAWKIRGLDHNSGLQGAFRDAVHELETMAVQHKVGALYLQLLQIRRGEKDLGLRREAQYRERVLELVAGFKALVEAAVLPQKVKQDFRDEIEVYRKAFQVYARSVLANQNIHGGKGPFRQSAHRLEALLNRHYVPDLESHILQLRRREKDYLLRGDDLYVDMTLKELNFIREQVASSRIEDSDKLNFTRLMENYQRDFMALVMQNSRIENLELEMDKAVTEIGKLVGENVEKTNLTMRRMAADIDTSSSADARAMLWIVVVASLLGILFAIFITMRISRPLRAMTDLLDRLAYEEPAERMPFVSGGRDEVNAMAESVNTMADHKSRFIAWWKGSMQEADACQRLEKLINGAEARTTQSAAELEQAEQVLRQALADRRALLSEQFHEIARLNQLVVERAQHLHDKGVSGETEIAVEAIRHSAQSIRDILEMTAFENPGTRNAA